MTNAVYQVTIEELEAVLSPRVVSRSLQEGLRSVGKSPDDVDYQDIDKILKAQVFRQLQVSMAVTEAKLRIGEILERVKRAGAEKAPAEDGTTRQAAILESLQNGLRPFNLYFEWPEVQKLRAQLQLLADEHKAGKEVPRLVQDAQTQLRLVEQKLEDQLVHQARELGELESSFETVKPLGGPKIRRLESLIGQIKNAQEGRQLAPAEAARARTLVTDLRKLVEASAVSENTEAGGVLEVSTNEDDLLSTEPVAEDLTGKLLNLDLQNEQQRLDALAKNNSHLLGYQPDLAEELELLGAQLSAQTSVAEDLDRLTQRFSEVTEKVRTILTDDLTTLLQRSREFDQEVDTEELQQRLSITLSVLETILPSPRDVAHIRSLFALAESREAELQTKQDAAAAAKAQKLSVQAREIASFETSLERFGKDARFEGATETLRAALASLKQAHDSGQLDGVGLEAARQAEAALEREASAQLEAEAEREAAQLRGLLRELRTLPAETSTRAATEALEKRLEDVLQTQATGGVDPTVLTEVHSDFEALKRTLQSTFSQRIDDLKQRAGDLDAKAVITYLDTLAKALADDVYPDLEEVERSLHDALEVRRSEQLNDLHHLEEELSGFAEGVSLPEMERLRYDLAQGREQLLAGQLISNLEVLWNDLERLESRLKERERNFLPRLDAALATFSDVAALNSDEVAQAGQLLRHLDGQRNALARVSAGVRAELEASLSKAETLLHELSTQFDATRAVADQLVGDNVLAGFFDTFEAERKPVTFSAPAPFSRDEELGRWAEKFATTEGVRSAVLLNESGELIKGTLDMEAATVTDAYNAYQRNAKQLGQELALGDAKTVVVETSGTASVSIIPAKGYRFVTIVEAESLDDHLSQLRSDLADLHAKLVST